MRAVLCGYYGQGNGGDEALLATLLQMLPAHVEPIVLSGNPPQTEADYEVIACDRKSTGAIVSAFRQSDALIWGGGSLMQDATSALSPIYYAGLMGLAHQLDLKTIAWAQGIGPLNRKTTQWMAKQVFSTATSVSVRDRASASLLAEWQVPFRLAPDPVWALEPQPVKGLWDLPAPRVAVSLRSHPLLTRDRLDVLAKAIADFQTATETCVLLLPFQPSQDLAIAEYLKSNLNDPCHILTLSDPRQLMGIFQGVELAIAMRLHALIMAASAECRCSALSYDPKVTQLMTEVDLPGWDLAQLPNDPRTLTMTWLDQYANTDGLSKAQIEAQRDRAHLHQDVLNEVLGR